MSATMYAAKSLRPDVQVKIAKAQVRVARQQRIRAIREGLAQIIDSGERDWEARKRMSCASGAEPSRTLLTAYAIAEAFDELVAKDIGQ